MTTFLKSAFFILVTTVLITSRLAQAAREVNVHADIEARLLAWQKSVPILNDVVYFNHSDEALHYLIRRIPEAKLIRNTRVVLERSIGEKPLYQRYVGAIRRGLASSTAHMSVVRARPPAFAGGMWGTSSAHCGSVRSEGYRLRRMLASMPLLSAAILPALIPTRHFAHGLSTSDQALALQQEGLEKVGCDSPVHPGDGG